MQIICTKRSSGLVSLMKITVKGVYNHNNTHSHTHTHTLTHLTTVNAQVLSLRIPPPLLALPSHLWVFLNVCLINLFPYLFLSGCGYLLLLTHLHRWNYHLVTCQLLSAIYLSCVSTLSISLSVVSGLVRRKPGNYIEAGLVMLCTALVSYHWGQPLVLAFCSLMFPIRITAVTLLD